MKKIMLGTSDAWSTRNLSRRTSEPAYYIVDCWIYGQPITTHSLDALHCDWLNIWISGALVHWCFVKNVNGLDLSQDVVSA